jgi:hypothetical protein
MRERFLPMGIVGRNPKTVYSLVHNNAFIGPSLVIPASCFMWLLVGEVVVFVMCQSFLNEKCPI